MYGSISRLFLVVMAVGAAAALLPMNSSAQHEGHGGMMHPAPVGDDAQTARKDLNRKLERLQEKIDKLEAAQENPNLSAGQRSGLEKKLEKLYQEKDRLLGGTGAARATGDVYACSMGDYSGPKTPDGRCPKCGMTLQLRSKAKPQAGAKSKAGETAAKGASSQEGVYVCPMGDYSGPRTGDGRCPKCGMNLQKK